MPCLASSPPNILWQTSQTYPTPHPPLKARGDLVFRFAVSGNPKSVARRLTLAGVLHTTCQCQREFFHMFRALFRRVLLHRQRVAECFVFLFAVCTNISGLNIERAARKEFAWPKWKLARQLGECVAIVSCRENGSNLKVFEKWKVCTLVPNHLVPPRHTHRPERALTLSTYIAKGHRPITTTTTTSTTEQVSGGLHMTWNNRTRDPACCSICIWLERQSTNLLNCV